MITVMTIAGFDPSAGAGILADIKTMSAFGCYGVAAITSLTFQNTMGVFGAHHQSKEVVLGQIDPLFDDFDIAAVKTGLPGSREAIEAVASALRARAVHRVVVDPVLRSTSGYDLISGDALDALTRVLFPLASVVTPNAAEAERITGIEIKNEQAMEEAARALLSLGPRAVLIKGGDIEGDKATDLLLDSQGAVIYSTPRVQSKHTHGTGCSFASALACLIAQGCSLRESIPVARRYISEAIRTAPGIGQGHGPLNHFALGFRCE